MFVIFHVELDLDLEGFETNKNIQLFISTFYLHLLIGFSVCHQDLLDLILSFQSFQPNLPEIFSLTKIDRK